MPHISRSPRVKYIEAYDPESGRTFKVPDKPNSDLNHNSWEKGEVLDTRVPGVEVPYLDENLQPITQSEWVEGYRNKFVTAGLA